MGEAKRRVQLGHGRQKPALPDLNKPRDWTINSYNPHTDTYLIESAENGAVIVSCLKCHQKLKEGAIYKGYKDENKYLQIVE
ncbi:MAG: hypothetical protein V7K21_20140 [Nostoc sp.]|uniref:hypothetical protein n=1 Tax=Nostoc sp. TaxID=1180 RepID=UPI002FF9046E